MDIRVGDIITMKKPHPCGEKKWQCLRTGADFRLRCMGCGHEVMVQRHKAEKTITSVEHTTEEYQNRQPYGCRFSYASGF